MGAIVLICIIGAIMMHIHKPKWHEEYGQRFQDIAYGSRQHNTYDLYLPNDARQKDTLASSCMFTAVLGWAVIRRTIMVTVIHGFRRAMLLQP